jgi:hypothetical protein
MPIDFQTWYREARAELENLQREKAELERSVEEREKQIAVLARTVNFLAPLVGEQPAPAGDAEGAQAGMTGSIREILKNAPEPLTASEIRDSLESLGFDMKSYSNPLATIHTVLRRLADANEVETTHEMAPGKRYAFVMPFRGVHLGTGKDDQVEKIAGRDFEIGKLKGFIGVGRLRRERRDKKER